MIVETSYQMNHGIKCGLFNFSPNIRAFFFSCAILQAMSYAKLAGLHPIYGLCKCSNIKSFSPYFPLCSQVISVGKCKPYLFISSEQTQALSRYFYMQYLAHHDNQQLVQWHLFLCLYPMFLGVQLIHLVSCTQNQPYCLHSWLGYWSA